MTDRSIAAELAARRCAPEHVLRWIRPGMNVIVGAANGEPVHVIDAIEAGAESLDNVRLHQMIALRSRPYINGQRPNLRHVSWFLSPETRDAFRRGDCDLVPNSFSDVPRLMRQALSPELAVCAG
jgi:acyl-CoA hydrolase